MFNALTRLANAYGSDKGDCIRFGHHYSALYDLIFHPLRDAELNVLEIGLAIGGPDDGGPTDRTAVSPSVRMWLEYFPKAQIFGFDITDFSHMRHPRFHFTRGDMGRREDLERLRQAAPSFDIIIDDGSHASYHQQLALAVLYEHLAPGGLYVIEDLHWQSPVFEAQMPCVPKTGEFLRAAITDARDVESAALPLDRVRAIRRATESFAIFPSFSESDRSRDKLAVFRKKLAHAPKRLVRSHDMFDTLVARRCTEPHDVFRIMGERLSVPGFLPIRLAAEASLSGSAYTINEIYQQVGAMTGISADVTHKLRDFEIAVEAEMLFPVAENCAAVSGGDLVVSDMYLPEAFLHGILQERCGISPGRLVLSTDGKASGRAWARLQDEHDILEHVGDNLLTDVASPRQAGIPARLTTVCQRTETEAALADFGLVPLSNLVREAGLRSWSPVEAERRIQLHQIQLNAPFLFLATLELMDRAKDQGWRRVLMSGRDCFLWAELYEAIRQFVPEAPEATYFHSSRLARVNPSPSYLRYVGSLCGAAPGVLVDLVGTGWSFARLTERMAGRRPEMFLIHHLDLPRLRQEYEALAPTGGESAPHAIFHRGLNSDENEVFEELNRAPFPLLSDVSETAGGFAPVFAPGTTAPADQATLERHHAAFRLAVALVPTLQASGIRTLQAHDRRQAMESLYARFEGLSPDLMHFREQKAREEALFISRLRKIRQEEPAAA